MRAIFLREFRPFIEAAAAVQLEQHAARWDSLARNAVFNGFGDWLLSRMSSSCAVRRDSSGMLNANLLRSKLPNTRWSCPASGWSVGLGLLVGLEYIVARCRLRAMSCTCRAAKLRHLRCSQLGSCQEAMDVSGGNSARQSSGLTGSSSGSQAISPA